MPTLKEFKSIFGFLKEHKRWWLAPFLFILVVLGMLMVFAESSALAPLIYTLF